MTHDRGAVAYGKRGKMRKAANAMVRAAPEQFTALAMPFLPELVEIMIADARDRECIGHRTAISGFLDGLKITGATDRLVEALLESLNLRDQLQLAQAASMYHSAAGATVEDAERAAVATIQTLVRAHPDRRARLLEACFGMRAADEPQEGRNGDS